MSSFHEHRVRAERARVKRGTGNKHPERHDMSAALFFLITTGEKAPTSCSLPSRVQRSGFSLSLAACRSLISANLSSRILVISGEHENETFCQMFHLKSLRCVQGLDKRGVVEEATFFTAVQT